MSKKPLYRLTTQKISSGEYASNVWKRGKLVNQRRFKNRRQSQEWNKNFRKYKNLDK